MWMCPNSYTHARALLGPYLKESLNTFVVGHWSVSRQMTSRHFCGKSSEDLIKVERVPSECSSTEPLPVSAYTWLVNHFSKEGDAVADVCSCSGYAMVAAFKAGRKALWLTSAPHYELTTLQTMIATLLQP